MPIKTINRTKIFKQPGQSGSLVYVQYSTPDQSKSGSACHMTRSANHRRHSVVIYIRGRRPDLGRIIANYIIAFVERLLFVFPYNHVNNFYKANILELLGGTL